MSEDDHRRRVLELTEEAADHLSNAIDCLAELTEIGVSTAEAWALVRPHLKPEVARAIDQLLGAPGILES